MLSKIKEHDKELEEDIDKFVNDKTNFQSRHFKDRYLEEKRLEKRKIEELPDSMLRYHIFQQQKKFIHQSYRKAYKNHLLSLSREELLQKIKPFSHLVKKN